MGINLKNCVAHEPKIYGQLIRENDDDLFAGPGLEGISLWDSLGEGFLKEASWLGMSFQYYYFLKF